MTSYESSSQYEEDRLLAHAGTGTGLGKRAAPLEAGLGSIPSAGPDTALKDLEQHLRDASEITVCGIATHPLIRAMQSIVAECASLNRPAPWESIRYLTPAHDLVVSNTGDARIGPVVQRWSTGLTGVRHAARSIEKIRGIDSNASKNLLQVIEIPSFYLGMVVIIQSSLTKRVKVLVTVGPRVDPDEPAYLLLTDDNEILQQIINGVERLQADGRQVQLRYVSCVPEQDIDREPPRNPDPETRQLTLTVSGLHPAYNLPNNQSSCHPTALIALRSKAAGEEIAILNQRTFSKDDDSIGRLSLLSEQIHEEDLAFGLGTPLFAHQGANNALDAMWRAARRNERTAVPHASFVHAAQREIATSCGLSISASRLRFCGYETIRREEDGVQLAFCIFELVLYRHEDDDELERAELWNPDSLVRINQQDLFSSLYNDRLNRFLTLKGEWLKRAVYSHPVAAFENQGEI